MTPVEQLLVRLVAESDALHEPIRDSAAPSWSATHQLRAGYESRGLPWRAGGSKEVERDLTALVVAGFAVRRRGRSKTIGVRLTRAGLWAARRLVGETEGEALGFAREIARNAPAGRWVPETAFNGGRGWGDGRGAELKQVAAAALGALSAGWAESNADVCGRVGYRLLPAGVEALEAAGAEGEAEDAPEPAAGALEVYGQAYRETLFWLDSLTPGQVGDANELGRLPLPTSAWATGEAAYCGP